MNWRVLGEAIRSPRQLGGIIRQFPPVIYTDFFRPMFPKTGAVIKYNDIIVEEERWLDKILPSFLTQYVPITDIPDYEDALIRILRQHVTEDDTVVVVGGGLGVSSVAAAKKIDGKGTVDIFEGSKKHVGLIEKSIRLNEVNDRCTVHHAIVAEAKDLRAHPGAASVIEPETLPDCDVLELDCEGAELEILQKMDITPRDIIVETHANLGAPKQKVIEVLSDRGYTVTDEQAVNEDVGIDIVAASRLE